MTIRDLGLMIVFIASLSEFAFSCLCEEQTIENALKNSSAVFTGKVLSIGAQYGHDFKLVEFHVWRVWKGPKIDRIEVKTPSKKDDCGYPFEKNEEYLVYATGTTVLNVSVCYRTAILEKAGSDVEKLMTLAKSVWVGTSNTTRDPFVMQGGDTLRTNRSTPTPKTLTVAGAVIIGIISRGAEYTALIRATDGKTFSMKVGDKLYDGEIAFIDQEGVVFLQNGRKVRKKIRPFPE